MPVIKSAKKKLKQDRKREKVNKLLRNTLKDALKDARKSKTTDKIISAVKLTDKAVKRNLIHKNKAARIKSSLSKLIKTASVKAKSNPKTTKKIKIAKNKK